MGLAARAHHALEFLLKISALEIIEIVLEVLIVIIRMVALGMIWATALVGNADVSVLLIGVHNMA